MMREKGSRIADHGSRPFLRVFGTCALLFASCKSADRAGVEWSAPESLAPGNSAAAAPNLAVAPDGRLAWAVVSGEPATGALMVNVAGTQTALRDTLGPIEPHGEAPPKLAFGPDGTLYVLYVVAKQVPGSVWPAYSLRVARSTDGKRFDPPITVTRDTVFGAFNFHALHAAADGSVYVGFLRGDSGKSAAYIARSSDHAETWHAAERVEPGEACPCCRVAIASTKAGTVFAAWRTVLPGDVRDIVVARSDDGGGKWSAPLRIHDDNWVFPGCPHAGPSLIADSAGLLHAAWWTAAAQRGGVYYAHSSDGATFSAPVLIDRQEHPRAAHPQVAIANDGTIVVTFERFTDTGARVFVRVSRDGGATFEPAIQLSQGERAAAFPVVAVQRDSVVVAWSEEDLRAIEEREAEHDAAVKEGKPVPLHGVTGARVWVSWTALRR